MLRLNKAAMRSLSTNNGKDAQYSLKCAQHLLEDNGLYCEEERYGALVSLTLNNQACYYNTHSFPVLICIVRISRMLPYLCY